MSNTYFDMLPYELIEIIFKKLHNSYMKDLNKEFNEYIDDNKYSQISMMCMIGECDCGGDCPGLNHNWHKHQFWPRYNLNHIDTPEEKEESKWLDSDSESESEDEDF